MGIDPTGKFTAVMARYGQPARAAEEFADMYRKWIGGAHETFVWDDIVPVGSTSLPSLEVISSAASGESLTLEGVAWIVLNGGLGTTMRMTGAKSLVAVREGKTFLDLIAGSVLSLRKRHRARLPLLFMDSFATDEETVNALRGKGLETEGLPLTFLQHRFPRIDLEKLAPYGDPETPAAWAPPGHGDLYLALECSGLIDRLLGEGMTHLFVSNADNLGAWPDPAILRHMKGEGVDFLMELTPRTDADLKGGALVTVKGVHHLLEAAMVPEGKMDEFTDPARFNAFNTNNLWIDLKALRGVVDGGGPELPVIVNPKEIEGVRVVQLEHAMGAAVSSFARARGLLVDRGRFAPVKTTEDLLLRRSDCYREGSDAPLAPAQGTLRAGGPRVTLDQRFYGAFAQLDSKIPHPLGLAGAESLTVEGEFTFGRGVEVVGRVSLSNTGPAPVHIPDGAILRGGD